MLPNNVTDDPTQPTDVRDRRWFRYLAVTMQAIAIIVTWQLWSVRETPPNLPLFGLPAVSVGWALLASLVLVLVRPLWGVALHSVLLAVAIVTDQMRLQPEMLSLTVLLWGTLPMSSSLFLCRAHLIALWWYAGFQKLLSPNYFSVVGGEFIEKAPPFTGYTIGVPLAIFVVVIEMALAVMLLFRKTRKPAVVMALLLHLGILTTLISLHWNWAVWPWNVAVACASIAFFWNWEPSAWQSFSASPRLVRLAAVFLLISPLAFYGGWVNGYLAYCLYTENTPRAWTAPATTIEPSDATLLSGETELNEVSFGSMAVPFPPSDRLYMRYFQQVAKPGTRMVIVYPQFWWDDRTERRVRLIEMKQELWIAEGNVRDGKATGYWEYFFPNGNREEAGTFKNGQRHGVWKLWHDNGKLAAQGSYREGREHGIWTSWSRAGIKELEGEFDSGMMHGSWTQWYANGREIKATYRSGTLVDKR